MPRKSPFTPEPHTSPDVLAYKTAPGKRIARRRLPAEKAPRDAPRDVPRDGDDSVRRERAEAPTVPPPGRGSRAARPSDVHHVKRSGLRGGATVDEVTADLTRDPRRERDEED